jgi:hypothetical protein
MPPHELRLRVAPRGRQMQAGVEDDGIPVR